MISRRSWSVLVALFVVAAQSLSPALAQTPFQESRGRVPIFLILGMYRDGVQHTPLQDAVVQRILDAKLGIALSPSLSPAELSCRETGCLEQLAGRYLDADYVVTTSVTADSSASQHRIEVWVFDIHPEGSPQPAAQPPMIQQSICKNCGDAQLLYAAANAAEQSLRAVPGHRHYLHREAATLLVDAPQPEAKETSAPRWTFGRGALLGASAALAASGLIAGSTVAAANRNANDDYGNPLPPNWAGYAGIGFLAAGVGILGASLALVPSLWKPRTGSPASERATSGRWTAGRGAAFGAFAGALVSSLVTTITFSQVTPPASRSYVVYDFQKPLALSAGLSGAWALGLTFSLIWPQTGSAVSRGEHG